MSLINLFKSPMIDESEGEVSLAVHFLFNPHALRILLPPNCQETKVEVVSQSVLENMLSGPEYLFAAQSKGWSHTIGKPVRCILRMVYIEICMNFIVPVSLLYRVAVCTKHLAQYGWGRYYNNQDLVDRSAAELKKHSSAIFIDAALYGGYRLLNFYFRIKGFPLSYQQGYSLIRDYVRYVTPATSYLGLMGQALTVAALAAVTFGPAFAVSCNYVRSLATLSIPNHTGAYLSLQLYNKLGLTTGEGTLLPYHAEDNMQPGPEDSISYVDARFPALIGYYEELLISDVRQALSILKEQPQQDQYPYDGHAVAKKLKKLEQEKNPTISDSQALVVLDHTTKTPSLLPLIERLETGQQRVDLLHRLYDDCFRIGEEDVRVLLNPISLLIDSRRLIPSIFEQEDYWSKINEQPASTATDGSIDITDDEIATFQAIAIPDNSNSVFITALIARLNAVKENRDQGAAYSVHEGISTAIYNVLELTPTDDAATVGRQRKKYYLQLHPDKNPGLDGSLFIFINRLFAVVANNAQSGGPKIPQSNPDDAHSSP